MLRNLFAEIYQNKNLLMLVCVGIYVLGLYGTLSGCIVFCSILLTLLLIYLAFRNFFPVKIVLIWAIIFYFGVINTSLRLKETDSLLDIAPVNATVYGKIASLVETGKPGKAQFIFDVKKIEYDGIVKNLSKQKVLVSLNTDVKFNIYDSYKINGRLSVPFRAGNPSQFDYGNYLRNFGIYTVFYGRNPYSMRELDIPCYEKIDTKLSPFEKTVQHIGSYRESILKVHSNFLPSPNLEILGGIVFGDDAVSPPENIKKSFVNSGLLHILAASGMNVAFIYSFFFLILNLFKIPFKINVGICMVAVLIYVLMTGLGASVLRAALMLLFVLTGKLIDRDAHSIALLSFVAFLMLIYNPMYLNDVGFQLSFIVTFGLLVMTPFLLQSKYKVINWIIGSVMIPIIAQLWVIPIQIFYFNNISIYSIFANIMSVPILSVISFGGFISSLISIIKPISYYVCHYFDLILNPLISLLVNISDFWGNLPNAVMQTTHPSPVQIILYYLILLNLTAFLSKEYRERWGSILKKSLPILIVILLISNISLPNKNLEVTVFDVGNADAILVKTPENKYIMIDTGKSGYNGGKSQAEMTLLKYFKDIGVKNIESIIITHFDNDHCGGAADLIKALKVNSIYVNSKSHSSNAAKEIYAAAKSKGTNVIEAENNQIVYKNNDITINNYIAKGLAGIGDNESSIITLLNCGNFSMLFMGDAGMDTFNHLKTYMPQHVTVLKVGHHGAPGVINKSMAEFLKPVYSVISTGENKFGHPSIYTLQTLRDSKTLRTDIHNSIRFIVTPENYEVKTYDIKNKKYENFLKY